jgi:oligopeptide/dipeptide ABC transporter ATP-binding protein
MPSAMACAMPSTRIEPGMNDIAPSFSPTERHDLGTHGRELILDARNIGVTFKVEGGVVEGVRDVSFQLHKGETIALVGESGSGKSVTARTIMRLLTKRATISSRARITMSGRDILGLSEGEMRKLRGNNLTMIFQEPMSSLNPVMTIGDQIGEALYLHEPLGRRERRARVLDLLAQVGIPSPHERIDSYPNQFSGGMRQRVMIAMALSCNPKLLIADEPTTALDVTIQAQVLDLLRKLRHTRDMAVMMISHDLGVIAEIADVVAVMYAGHVVETGTVDEIFFSAAHPYTRGLLESIPRLDDDRARLHQIKGSVPSPRRRPAGCPFAARCPLRQPVCTEKMPPMFEFGAGHKAACWVTSGAVQ